MGIDISAGQIDAVLSGGNGTVLSAIL